MILRKKMLRDLWEHKGTTFALCVIIAMGLCMFIALYMTMDSLTNAIDDYYSDYHFGDAFASVTAISQNHAQKLTQVEGIEQVTSRLSKDVRVLFEGNDENVYVRLISYDSQDPDALNLPYVFDGPPIGQEEEGIYISPSFADANHLKAGSYLPVLLDGKRKELLVLGTAQTPEYIYAISGATEIYPNPALFGVAIVPEDLMDQLFSTSGIVNSLSFRLSKGVEFSDIEIPLKDQLKGSGLISLVARKDQISNFMLAAEVKQLKAMGQSIPFLLLFISSIILIITLRRRVEAQRGQIGIMLAFGYTKGEILWHYLSYGLVIGLIGGLIGIMLGLVVLDAYVDLYKVYFTIPGFVRIIVPKYLILSLFLAVACSMGACAFGCRDVMKLQPSEAMRPPAPPIGQNVFFEKIPSFWNMLTTSGKMAVRNMVRSPFRSFVSMGGVGLVFAMMAVVFSFNNIMDIMITNQFEKIETYDTKVKFSSYLDDAQIERELTQYTGMNLVETILEVPCQLRNKNLIEDTVVIGLSNDARLFNIMDKNGEYLHPSEKGAILSESLAKKLDVTEGSILTFDSSLLEDPKQVVVNKIIPQYLGSNIYMEKEALWDLLGHGKIVSSAMLLAPQKTISAFKSDYRLSEKISAISRADEMYVMVTDYMDSYIIMIFLMGIAVSLIGFIIVYNSAVISFSERSRELASLSVLGLDNSEVAEVISFEQWILSFFGMVLGIPLTYLLSSAMSASLQNDVYSMPMVVPVQTIILAFLVTCAYLYIAQLQIGRKVKKLKIVDVLKERE